MRIFLLESSTSPTLITQSCSYSYRNPFSHFPTDHTFLMNHPTTCSLSVRPDCNLRNLGNDTVTAAPVRRDSRTNHADRGDYKIYLYSLRYLSGRPSSLPSDSPFSADYIAVSLSADHRPTDRTYLIKLPVNTLLRC